MAGHDPDAPALFDIGGLAPPTPTTDVSRLTDASPRPVPAFIDLEGPRYAYMFGFFQADGISRQAPGTKAVSASRSTCGTSPSSAGSSS